MTSAFNVFDTRAANLCSSTSSSPVSNKLGTPQRRPLLRPRQTISPESTQVVTKTIDPSTRSRQKRITESDDDDDVDDHHDDDDGDLYVFPIEGSSECGLSRSFSDDDVSEDDEEAEFQVDVRELASSPFASSTTSSDDITFGASPESTCASNASSSLTDIPTQYPEVGFRRDLNKAEQLQAIQNHRTAEREKWLLDGFRNKTNPFGLEHSPSFAAAPGGGDPKQQSIALAHLVVEARRYQRRVGNKVPSTAEKAALLKGLAALNLANNTICRMLLSDVLILVNATGTHCDDEKTRRAENVRDQLAKMMLWQ